MTHYQDGYDAGRSAGSWVIDGNTPVDTARSILQGLEDGDPQVMGIEPSPLSGEWAGESIPELIDGYRDMSDEEQGVACDQYEEGFSVGFWDEVARSATAIA